MVQEFNQIDSDFVPSLMKCMIRNIENTSPRVIPLALMESASFFVTSSLINMFSGYRAKIGSTESMVNYFGIVFLESGGGKNVSLNGASSLFSKAVETYPSVIRNKAKENSSPLPNGDVFVNDAEGLTYPTNFFTPIDGTKEGFQFLMQGMSRANYSSLNLVEDEFGDILMNADMLSRIKSAWEDGEGKGKTTAGSRYFAVKDICVNVFMFGSPHSIRKSKAKSDKLDDVFAEGYLRRSFIFFDKDNEIIVNKNKDKLDEVNKLEMKNDVDEWLDTMIRPTWKERQYVTMTDGARNMHQEYMETLIDNANKNKKDLFARAMASSDAKIIRLSAIIAIMDFSLTIEPRHMKYAIDFTERTSGMAKKMFIKEPAYIRLFDACTNANTGRNDIMLESGIENIKSFDENLELAEEYGDKLGYALIRHKIGKTTYYKFESLHIVDENKISISASKDLAKSYETHAIKWIDLHKVLKSEYNYSAGSFIEGHRSKSNYSGSQDIIIFDIDGGMSLNLAKAFFSQWKSIIATTKSHQKDKNGIVCDRFRVVLLPNVKLELDSEKYSEFMKNIITKLSIPADMSCTDSSRFYYGYLGAEIWYSESQNRFDISCCIPETKKESEQQEIYKENKHIKSVDGVERYFLTELRSGNRNNGLLRYCLMMKDDGQDWRSKTLALNAMLNEPLEVSEIENTIFKTASKQN